MPKVTPIVRAHGRKTLARLAPRKRSSRLARREEIEAKQAREQELLEQKKRQEKLAAEERAERRKKEREMQEKQKKREEAQRKQQELMEKTKLERQRRAELRKQKLLKQRLDREERARDRLGRVRREKEEREEKARKEREAKEEKARKEREAMEEKARKEQQAKEKAERRRKAAAERRKAQRAKKKAEKEAEKLRLAELKAVELEKKRLPNSQAKDAVGALGLKRSTIAAVPYNQGNISTSKRPRLEGLHPGVNHILKVEGNRPPMNHGAVNANIVRTSNGSSGYLQGRAPEPVNSSQNVVVARTLQNSQPRVQSDELNSMVSSQTSAQPHFRIHPIVQSIPRNRDNAAYAKLQPSQMQTAVAAIQISGSQMQAKSMSSENHDYQQGLLRWQQQQQQREQQQLQQRRMLLMHHRAQQNAPQGQLHSNATNLQSNGFVQGRPASEILQHGVHQAHGSQYFGQRSPANVTNLQRMVQQAKNQPMASNSPSVQQQALQSQQQALQSNQQQQLQQFYAIHAAQLRRSQQ